MMRKLKSGVFLSLSIAPLLALAAPSMSAQWTEQGTALCTAAWDQQFPKVVSDGEGGAIIAWGDFRSGSGIQEIYAQRVDAFGVVQWATDGVVLCTSPGYPSNPSIVSDGAGGAIVIWGDARGGSGWDIYAQRLNASGAVQWTTNGVALCTAMWSQMEVAIASDGEGGAIATWRDGRSGIDDDIYAQRVDASGVVQWTTDGVALCAATGYQWDPAIVSDGGGGAIIAWDDYRSGDPDIYAQRVNASGVVQWATDGVTVCTASNWQTAPTIVSAAAGGAIIAWADYRSGSYDVYAQRVDTFGLGRWMTDGVALCTATGWQLEPAIASDGAGGAIVAWQDYRSGDTDIYAQRVDASGSVRWTADGVALCAAVASQDYPKIVSNGAGGAVVAWRDGRTVSDSNIYAQGVDGSGAVQWATDGLALCTATGNQESPAIASDGGGGAIVTWYDARTGIYDIYAQRVTRQGYWGYPAPEITSVQDVPGDQGGRVRVSFARSRLDSWPDLAISYYSVWRALSAPATLAMKSHGIRLPSPSHATAELVGKAYYSSYGADWELVGAVTAHLLAEYGLTATTLRDSTSVDPGLEYFFVSAHGIGTFDFWDSPPDSGYSVDNLSPCSPGPLAAEYIGSQQLFIHWRSNSEADLSHYALYKGSTPDFVPDEASRIGTATDTSFVDDDFGYGEHYYKVSAIDVHENESGFALLTPDMITGTPGGNRPYGNMLFQNAPNPFLSSTRIAFSTKEEGHVRLSVFDARGRLVRVLVDGVRGPSQYVEEWDGSDGSGRRVAAGTYFYLLEVPGWSGSKKMTLAR